MSTTTSLRKGVKWPMSALGRRATLGCRASEIDMVRGASRTMNDHEPRACLTTVLEL